MPHLKIKAKRFSAIITALLLITVVLSVQITSATSSLRQVSKDETVFGFLNPDGTVKEVRIVNRLILPEPSIITDLGRFASVRAMTPAPVPTLTDVHVKWDLSEPGGRDFYYEGVLKDDSLPILVSANWQLDGEKKNAYDMVGAEGFVVFTLDITPNAGFSDALRDGFLVQVQSSVDLDKVPLVTANGATRSVFGHKATFTWTLFPGESGSFGWSGYAIDFASDPVIITLVRPDSGAFPDINQLTEAITELEDGSRDIGSGALELASGLGSIDVAISDLAEGMVTISDNMSATATSTYSVATNFHELNLGFARAKTGLSRLIEGAQPLLESVPSILSGQNALQNGVAGAGDGNAQLAQLALTLADHPDPSVQALVNGVLAQQSAFMALSAGMEKQAEGLKEFMSGVTQAFEGFSLAHSGMESLQAGMSDMQTGLNALAHGQSELAAASVKASDGLNIISTNMADITSGAEELAKGQELLSDGLKIMNTEIYNAFPRFEETVSQRSFTDPSTFVNSLQYILSLPGIDEIEAEKPGPPLAETLPWYLEFWRRLVSLFGL